MDQVGRVDIFQSLERLVHDVFFVNRFKYSCSNYLDKVGLIPYVDQFP
jgi:hypothetical protein